MSNDADDRDAWLDDVRRWYYGGTPPATDHERDDEAPGRRDEIAPRRGEAPRGASLSAPTRRHASG